MTEDNVQDLTAAAKELIQRIEKLDDSKGTQIVRLAVTGRRNRQLIWILAAVVAVLLVFASLVANNANRIDSVTQRLDKSQTVGRKQALCPLYQLFLDSKSDRGRMANPRGPKAYDEAFAIIERGYKALECNEFKDPGTPLPGPK